MAYYTERPLNAAFFQRTWQIHVTLPREIRRIEKGLTHEAAADLMKVCRALFPKSVIICSKDKADQ